MKARHFLLGLLGVSAATVIALPVQSNPPTAYDQTQSPQPLQPTTQPGQPFNQLNRTQPNRSLQAARPNRQFLQPTQPSQPAQFSQTNQPNRFVQPANQLNQPRQFNQTNQLNQRTFQQTGTTLPANTTTTQGRQVFTTQTLPAQNQRSGNNQPPRQFQQQNTNLFSQPNQDQQMGVVMNGIQKWLESTRPSQNHKLLATLVGTWNADVKFSNFPNSLAQHNQAQPGAASNKPQAGRVVTTWSHGDRFLRSEFTGGAGGSGFTASATYGFNNATGQFEGTWMDSLSTGMRFCSGTVDPSGKTFTFFSDFADPMNGSPVTFKEVISIQSNNQYTRKVFGVGPSGVETRVQEVVYTRVN